MTKVILYDNLGLEDGILMIYKVEFYCREDGKVPVKEFLLSLNPKMRAKAFSDIELLSKHGFYLREPYVKPLKGRKNQGLYELRIKFSGDIARIFYFSIHNNRFVLLSGFIKKTDKTPERELERARKYREDFERRCMD